MLRTGLGDSTTDVTYTLWWTETYVTGRNANGAEVSNRILLDPDGYEGSAETLEVDLTLSKSEPYAHESNVPYVSHIIVLHTYDGPGTYVPEAWIYAGDNTGYAKASVMIGEYLLPSEQSQTGTGKPDSPPTQDYGDTSQAREVIITLIYMLEQRRGELPQQPPNLDELDAQFLELPTIRTLISRGYEPIQIWGAVYSGLFRLPDGVTYEEAVENVPKEFPDILEVAPEFD